MEIKKLMKITKYDYEWNVREETYDSGIIDEVYGKGQVYDLSKVKFTRRPQVIFDIGAHIGSFSVKCAQEFPDAKIYCFEPIDENYELVSLNTKSFDNITAFNLAVAGDLVPAELETLYYGPNGVNTGGSNFIYGSGLSSTPYIQAKALMNWHPYIDILKIDCEGGEVAIFPQIDFNRVGVVMIEFHLKLFSKDKVETVNIWNKLMKQMTDAGLKEIFRDHHYWFCPMLIFARD